MPLWPASKNRWLSLAMSHSVLYPRESYLTVRREHDLMPEKAQKGCRRGIPAAAEKEDEESEEHGITKDLLAVLGKSAVVEPFILYSLMEGLKFQCDILLSIGIKGGVFDQVCFDVMLDLAGRIVTGRQSSLHDGFVLGGRFLGVLESDTAGRAVQLHLVDAVMVMLPEGTALYRRGEVHPCSFYPSDSVAVHAPYDVRGV